MSIENYSKVSIICGVYNAEKYLNKCLNSMIAQTYPNIEIILIVNASHDSSEKIVRIYENQYSFIRAFYVEQKLGAGGSRQYGFKYSTGDWICFVDCDDELDKDYVTKLMEAAQQGDDTDIAICNFAKIDINGKYIYKREFKNERDALVQSIAPWGKMFKRTFFEKNHLELRNIPFGEDILFSIEVYLLNPRVKLNNYLGYFWLDNPRSTSHTELRGFPIGVLEAAALWFEDMGKKYPDKHRELEYFCLKYFVWYLLQSGRWIGKKKMLDEYNKTFNYLYISSPNWNTFKERPLFFLAGERFVVKVVLFSIRLFEKLHLSKMFFSIYSQSFLGNFWPSL